MTARDDSASVAARVWSRVRPLAIERVERVRVALEELAAGALVPGGRAEAHADAHKLAGSLGTYGYPEGSEIARRAEVLLDEDARGDQVERKEATALASALAAFRDAIARD